MRPPAAPGRASDIDTLLDDYAHALAVQPFLDRFPALLADLTPTAPTGAAYAMHKGACIPPSAMRITCRP